MADDQDPQEPAVTSETARQKDLFRHNFRRHLERLGWSLDTLAEQSGIDRPTLRRWMREGVAQPKYAHIECLARLFGIDDPWSLMREEADPVVRPADGESVDRQTNPVIEDVLRDAPELFQAFSEQDWDEIYSHHGTGGPLTYDGVVRVAQRINEKRDLRRKFETLLETEHFALLRQVVDVLYRDVRVTTLPMNKISKSGRR